MLGLASQLDQRRPAVTTAVNAFSPSVLTEITLIVVCNTTANAESYSIYHDDDGTTFNDDTALYRNVPIPANETHVIELPHAGAGISVSENGSVAVQSSTASAINFTMYGKSTDVIGAR